MVATARCNDRLAPSLLFVPCNTSRVTFEATRSATISEYLVGQRNRATANLCPRYRQTRSLARTFRVISWLARRARGSATRSPPGRPPEPPQQQRARECARRQADREPQLRLPLAREEGEGDQDHDTDQRDPIVQPAQGITQEVVCPLSAFNLLYLFLLPDSLQFMQLPDP